jgi:translation initiation factor IF-2
MPQGKQPMGGGRPGGKDFKHGKGPVTPLAVETAPVETVPKVVRIHDPLTVSELAQRLKLRETEIIKHLFMKGAMVTVNQTLDVAYARSVAEEFGFEIEEAPHPALNKGEYNPALAEKKQPLDETKYKHLQPRPPVVSIMGHVDHGKTSLLDAIRETRHKIVDTEAGGITQSIGAYTVEKNGQKIVFLDTPGHEAFTSMRMRGAKATDVAILVVAADDGVMPQTIEAINHAKAANIPIIVAVNKIDKAGADPEKVLVQLSDHGLVSEKWGGDTVTVEVSALQLIGLDDLLEMILLVSELLELKADPTVQGEGVIIEAQLDKRKGPTATALVQNGTLKVGDNVLIGAVGGRVRALFNDSGERVIKAGPATPVEILGLSDVPRAGDPFQVIRDEKKFKQLFNEAKLQERDQRLGSRSLSTGFATSGPRADGSGEAAAEQKEFNVIIKADTQGSAEAVNGALSRLSTDEIKVKVLHTGTGDISEADVMLATASQALIIGFNVREDGNAQRTAEQAGVQIKKYDVIYHINEEMEKLMLGKLSPETQEVESGQAEVRQLFTVGKNVVIAGCMVTKGKVVRNGKAKVTRNGKEIFAGTVDNLKRFKDDAKEVAAGYECGISFNKFNDLEIGDIITVFTVEETERTSL